MEGLYLKLLLEIVSYSELDQKESNTFPLPQWNGIKNVRFEDKKKGIR